MKILVVDDSAIARKFLIKSLPASVNPEVRECVNGLECVQAFSVFRPDVVFLDLTMPVMNGIEALENIMQEDPDAAVYVLTADIQKATQKKIMSLGARSFLNKPPSKDTIAGTVIKLAEELRSR